MKLKWDYEHSILQVSGSLYSWYGIQCGHGTDPDLDTWLRKNEPGHVIALLIDAMGVSILEKHLPEDSFLRSHMHKQISTVFPPTTAAATTAFMSGMSPAETGWLGWNQYFAEKDDELILFFSQGQYSNVQYEKSFCDSVLPARKIFDVLKENGREADSIWPGWSEINPCSTFDDLLARTVFLSQENEFLYVYWDELDTLMHRHGTDDEIIRETVREYDRKLQEFCNELPDKTALVIIADHSQVNTRMYVFEEDDELIRMLESRPALEQRTVAFYVKDGCRKQFRDLFEERFGDDFVLLDSNEALELFGPGEICGRTRGFLGDYVAVGISDLELDYMPRSHIGNHAGFLEEERMVPLILWNS